eukprot:m.480020 g.480020  ORF g.480020 m.480020 type:complete len:83 (-) comp51480_c0_seq1:289-537(-)
MLREVRNKKRSDTVGLKDLRTDVSSSAISTTTNKFAPLLLWHLHNPLTCVYDAYRPSAQNGHPIPASDRGGSGWRKWVGPLM